MRLFLSIDSVDNYINHIIIYESFSSSILINKKNELLLLKVIVKLYRRFQSFQNKKLPPNFKNNRKKIIKVTKEIAIAKTEKVK